MDATYIITHWLAARNNLAETLAAGGCAREARIEITRARELAKGTPFEALVAPRATHLADARPKSSARAAAVAPDP